MDEQLGGYWLTHVVSFIAGFAALNWAIIEFFDTDVLVDTLGLTGDTLTGTYLAIGVAGGILLYNTAVIEFMD